MTTRLWSQDDYLSRLDADAPEIRRWAAERLLAQHPRAAVDALLPRFAELEPWTARDLTGLIETRGAAGRGDALLAALERSDAERAAWLLRLLGRSGHPQALPTLERAISDKTAPTYRYIDLFAGLAAVPGEEARTLLRRFAADPRRDVQTVALRAMLERGDPSDLAAALDSADPIALIESFRQAFALQSFSDAIRSARREGIAAALETLEGWSDSGQPLPAAAEEALRRSSAVSTWLQPLGEAIRARMADSGVDPAALGDAPLSGWRWLAVSTLALTAWLLSRVEAQLPLPEATGDVLLAAAARVLEGWDEQKLEERAEETSGLRGGLLHPVISPQQVVSPKLEETASLLGVSALPTLEVALEAGPYWGGLRAARVVERIALRDPDGCVRAAPALIVAMQRDEGDFLREAAERALKRVGVGKLDAISQRLEDPAEERAYMWLDFLADIPTDESAQLLLSWLEDGEDEIDEEIVLYGLRAIAPATAIEPLRPLVSEGHELAADALLVTLLLHRPADPLVATCRQALAKAQAVRAERQAMLDRMIAGASQGSPAESVHGRNRLPQRKALSRKERKKRAEARKQSRKKGKKKR